MVLPFCLTVFRHVTQNRFCTAGDSAVTFSSAAANRVSPSPALAPHLSPAARIHVETVSLPGPMVLPCLTVFRHASIARLRFVCTSSGRQFLVSARTATAIARCTSIDVGNRRDHPIELRRSHRPIARSTCIQRTIRSVQLPVSRWGKYSRPFCGLTNGCPSAACTLVQIAADRHNTPSCRPPLHPLNHRPSRYAAWRAPPHMPGVTFGAGDQLCAGA